MVKKYKHLFFDLDHTLWDFDRNSELTLQQLFNEYRLNSDYGIEDFDKFFETFNAHNDRLWERFRNGFIKREDLRWKRIWYTLLDYKIGDTNLAYELSAAYLEILPRQTILVPHAKEILEYCSDKYQMHLITNGFETTQWQKLQFSGISGFFSQIITSEKSNSLKPHKEIFDYALSATGAKQEESIMIGDAIDIDILGAINAGWDQIYYNPHKVKHNRKPTYEVESLDKLLDIL